MEIIERFGTDALRYWLSREMPTFDDGDFTEDKFLMAYEGNLVNGLGNYISRVSTMVRSYFDSTLEKPAEADLLKVPLKKGEVEYVSVEYFIKEVIAKEYKDEMEKFELSRASDRAFTLLKELDGYVQGYEPYKLIKTDKEKTRAILWNLSYGAVSLARFLEPFLPGTSEKIFEIFGVNKDDKEFVNFKVKEHKALFPRIE